MRVTVMSRFAGKMVAVSATTALAGAGSTGRRRGAN